MVPPLAKATPAAKPRGGPPRTSSTSLALRPASSDTRKSLDRSKLKEPPHLVLYHEQMRKRHERANQVSRLRRASPTPLPFDLSASSFHALFSASSP